MNGPAGQDADAADNTADEGTFDPPPLTGLNCVVAVARHHGIDLSVDGLRHGYVVEAAEPDPLLMRRMAEESGLKARETRLDWADLATLEGALPAILCLRNGRYVVLAAWRPTVPATDTTEAAEEHVVVADPLAEGDGALQLTRAKLETAWDGRTLLLKRHYRLTDPDRPFGIGWFVPEILRQRGLFGEIAIAVFAMHLLALALPIFFQIVIDRVLPSQAVDTLIVLGIGILAALLFEAVFSYLRARLLLHATARIDVRVATRTFAHLLALPIGFFDRIAAGVLTKHMQQTGQIREFLTGRLFITLLEATALIVFVPVLIAYSGILTLVVLAFTAIIAAMIGLLIAPYRRRLQNLYTAEGERQAMLIETIANVETVKALALEPRQRRRWDALSARAIEMHVDVGGIAAIARALSGFLEKAMLVAVIGVGALLVFDNTISVGALIAFQMLAGRVTGPLVQIVSLVHEYQETALSVRMLGTVMNQRPERTTTRGLARPVRGAIAFEDVTFRYGPDVRPALERVTVDIPAGARIGLVGRSGSGKTSFTRLIQGFHLPQDGTLRVDGVDIRQWDLAHLRGQIAVVLQASQLFQGTVADNIRVSRPGAPIEAVVRAAEMAGATEFVERLPKGFDTDLEEGATNLSGGQRQRLAIARALLRDPAVLLLDEATSALDPESEGIIQRNLNLISKGRTVIIVSHRLTTLTECDSIIVLDQGRIVDQGRHDALIRRPGVYATLWNQQTGHLTREKL